MTLDVNLNQPMHDILPQDWKTSLATHNLDYCPFRNLTHFKHYVSQVKQKQDDKCGVSYAEALQDLLQEKSQYDKQEYESIRDLVRSNLLKRGLITEDIYESYKYASEGVIVDIAKVINEDPNCFLTPVKSYTNHFYELYISISYPYHVSDAQVRKNAIKLLATIEELERQHIYIKITLVFADQNPVRNGVKDMLITIPLFNYKDFKSIETMSAIVNERLLRKFMFALLEDVYAHNLSSTYGNAMELDTVINIGDDLNEIELFTQIVDQVVVPGTK